MEQLAGTRALVRLAFHRDRFVLLAWVAVLASLPGITVAAFEELFPTEAQRQIFFATTASQPSYSALLGPGFGPSLGALAIQRSGLVFLFAGLASVLTVIRHTRTEEEAGRRELLGSTVVGRHAPLTAALTVTLGAHALVGFMTGFSLLALGLPISGSIAFGGALMLTGWIYAGGSAIAGQLTEGAGAARGIALAALGLTFLARALGDAAGTHGATSRLAWLSPIGWMQRVQAFEGERWWIFALGAGVFAALTVTAYQLAGRRDIGAGMLPRRLGPAAGPSLRSPLAFAWRLHRTRVWAWSVAFAAAGAVVGMVTRDVTRAVESTPGLLELVRQFAGDGAIADAYIAAMVGLLAFVASAFAIQSALELRVEEETLRGELVLASAVTRSRWATSHLVFALAGPGVALALFGLTTGLVFGLSIGDATEQVVRVTAAALAYLPAVWLQAAVATAAFGIAPRFTSLGWVALALSLFLTQFGPLLDLPPWVLDLSPYSHVPRLTGGDPILEPVTVLLSLAAVGITTGLVFLGRRDFGV